MPDTHVLIVDDEIALAKSLQKWLISSDYSKPAIATSGRTAIQKALDLRPDLILMDVRLADDIDGIEAAEEILTQLDVPIIYMTAYLDEEIIQRAKITEPFGYLLKPFEGGDLQVAIEMALYKHKMQRKRKQVEEALRLSEERYRLAQRLAYIGSWEWDIRTQVFYWSDQLEAILGFNPGEFEGSYEAFLEAVHPDDRPLLNQAINNGLEDDREYEIEHRVIWPDSTVHWVLGRGRLVKDGFNQPVRFVGVVQDITAQKQAQQALIENEQRYRSISELISDYAYNYYLFPDGTIEVIWITEEAFKRIFGLCYKEMEERGGLLSFVYPEDRPLLKQAFGAVLQNGHPYATEYRIVTLDGKIKWIRDSGRAVQWSSPAQKVLVYGAAQDITERKQAEEALQRRNNELALLNNVSQAFLSTLNLDQVLTSVLNEVRNLLGVIACSAWLIDQETGELVCRQVTDPQGQIVRGWRLAPGQGIVGWVAQQGKSLLVSDTQTDPRHYKKIDQKTGLEIHSILSVPLRVNQAVIGVVQAVDKTINRFTESDLALLEPLAATAAIAIENARLYEQTRQDAETKATLLREVNHRVKNNLAAIIGLLYAEQQYLNSKDGEAYQDFIRDLINRIHGLATAHHLLSEAQWLPLPLHNLIEQIISSALQALPLDKYISVEVSPTSLRIAPKQANDLALVINELTTNTMKYALTGRRAAWIMVHIVQKDDIVQLEFRDDGPGYPDDVLEAKHYNVGIYLIQTVVTKGLDGEVSFHNDEGAVTQMRFRIIA